MNPPAHQPNNERTVLHDLSDLDAQLIKAVADQFISLFGQLDPETGQPVDNLLNHTMADELKFMLDHPELGLRQVVPLIAMWVDQFDLPFDDPLFQLELNRLQAKQQLADHLDMLISLNRPMTVDFSILEILAMLNDDEFCEGLPYVEYQVIHKLLPPPKDIHELIERIRKLSQYTDASIKIKITPELIRKQKNKTKQPDVLLKEAHKWLDQMHEKYPYNISAFFREYEKLPDDMKQAVNQVMEQKSKQFSSKSSTQPAHCPPTPASESEVSPKTPFQKLIFHIIQFFGKLKKST